MARRIPKTDQQSKTTGVLADVVDLGTLRRLAGGRSFDRGEYYFRCGRVECLCNSKDVFTASVQGREEYAVRLWTDEGQLFHECSCPMGQNGAFCKHCAAVGLAWLEQHKTAGKAAGRQQAPPLTMDDVEAYLLQESKESLVRIVMEQASEDERLRERLLLSVVTHRTKLAGGEGSVQPFLDAIDRATKPREFVHYREAFGVARGIDDAIDAVEALLDGGNAAEAVQVLEHAYYQVHDAVEHVDDSDGNVGSVLCRIGKLHLAACKKAHPDPESLAKRLLDLELASGYGEIRGSVAAYADVLGAKGLARYRQLAEALWADVPALGPGQDEARYGNRFAITSIMEALALVSGNLDEWIAVKSRDLSHAYTYFEIAQRCAEANKHDLALEWAEKGVKAFPARTDSRLREFLAQAYHRRKRHDEAMTLVWKGFAEDPCLGAYQSLKQHATQAKDWPAWREKALAFIRETIAKEKQKKPKPRHWFEETDNSVLVAIFLWEKDGDAAWREANEGGCAEHLWIELAKDRAKDHPEDALPIYMKRIKPIVDRTNNSAYEEAVKYVRIIRDLMKRLERSAEFNTYLAGLRVAHKAKRNFMKLLATFG